MLTPASPLVVGAPQCGERVAALDLAWQHGLTAVAELGFTARLEAAPAHDPGAWHCTLHQEGVPVPGGFGSGKGPEAAARVGAVFEALEHHLSCAPPEAEVILSRAHQVATGPLAGDTAVALLAEGPDLPLACLPYRPLAPTTGEPGAGVDSAGKPVQVLVPVFLSTPDYLELGEAARAAAGDAFDYTAVCRYSINSGWAAGVTPTEAAVHAINEIIERDAMSLLLIDQFLHRSPTPLRVVDMTTLPAGLAALHTAAESRLGRRVWLLEMTTDIGVPAYWAYTPGDHPGSPSRVRGCGASLSAHYAVERALSELIQCHSGLSEVAEQAEDTPDHTSAHPVLHRCRLADFSTRLHHTTHVPFTDTTVPATPHGHLAELTDRLTGAGFTIWTRERFVSEHLAVLNVLIPGMERFMLITDGQLVLPGPRGRTALTLQHTTTT